MNKESLKNKMHPKLTFCFGFVIIVEWVLIFVGLALLIILSAFVKAVKVRKRSDGALIPK